MPQTVGNGQSGETHFNQQTGMAMADLVQPDPLHFSVFGSPYHLMFKERFGIGENSVMLMEAVEPVCIAFNFIP